MSTITRERAQEIFLGNGPEPTASEERELARIALASLEAEAVAWIVHARTGDQLTADGGYVANAEGILGLHSTPLYTAPPALASVPDERAAFNAWNNDTDCPLAGRDAKTAAWLAWSRRAAMLQGADGNTPVIPDGWVACSERMPSPSTGVIVAAPWQSAPGGYAMKWATNCPWHPDADTDGWITPGASWSPTHWMPLPAAPQQ